MEEADQGREPYTKERERKPDGRYVIYYTFAPSEGATTEPAPQGDATGERLERRDV